MSTTSPYGITRGQVSLLQQRGQPLVGAGLALVRGWRAGSAMAATVTRNRAGLEPRLAGGVVGHIGHDIGHIGHDIGHDRVGGLQPGVVAVVDEENSGAAQRSGAWRGSVSGCVWVCG